MCAGRASSELGAHRDVLELRGLSAEAELGFIELGGIPAVWAAAHVSENLDVRREQQLDELITGDVGMANREDREALAIAHSLPTMRSPCVSRSLIE